MAIKVYVNDNGTPTLVEMAAESAEALAKLVSAAQAQSFTDDEKAQARSNIGAFATTGGALTGQIINAVGDLIRQSKTDGYTSIKGGTDNSTGGYFTAFGKDHESAGRVEIGTNDGTNACSLVVTPAGTLTLGGKNVVRSVDGTVADAGGNVNLSSTYLKTTGGTMTGDLTLKPLTGEGGQILLDASSETPTLNGIYIDTVNGLFRIFGKPSNDGTSVTGTGSTLSYNPYTARLNIGSSQVPTLATAFTPNYAAGVAISSGYTAPSVGMVHIQSAGNYKGVTEIYINGSRVGTQKSTDYLDATVTAWVNTGDVVEFTNGGSAPTAYFYPLKIGG